MAKREDVVLAQALDVAQLEAAPLGARDDRRRGHELAVGKDIAIDEPAALPHARRDARA